MLKDFTLKEVSLGTKDPTPYQKFTDKHQFLTLQRLSKNLKDKTIVHISAVPEGGGVAEILKSLIPFTNGLGFSSHWFTLPADNRFFEITKKLHNLLQGKKDKLTQEDLRYYLEYNKSVSQSLERLKADVFIVHDPQPLALVESLPRQGAKFIWQNHLDTSTPNVKVWEWVRSIAQKYDHLVFTLQDYADKSFDSEKSSFITPAIDPLSAKNIALPRKQALDIVSSLGINIQKPIVTQVSRFDPWKNPIGAVDSFILAKKKIKNLQLVFLAQSSEDDPEEEEMYKYVKNYTKGLSDVKIILDAPNNDLVVNAFQTASDIILQLSTREGFGLSVTEAMWKKALVIGGDTAGIRSQIDHGLNGFISKTEKETSELIVNLLSSNVKTKRKIGKNARKKVSKNFLLPGLAAKYITLFQEVLNS